MFEAIEESVGNYKLLGVLAEGKLARLHLAQQIGPRGFAKIVALKRVLPQLSGRPEFREAFLNAAIVEARLEHPNILSTYELGEVDGQYFISMEYLPGEDLESVLEMGGGRPVPFAVAAAISLQAARALSYAHEQVLSNGAPVCIVHRRVKPSNVAVTYQGDVKLLDFGMAKVRSGAGRSLLDDTSYFAPEMLVGETLDARTDIFCLGIVLWECLTGRRLFDAPSPELRARALENMQISAPSTIERDVPSELDAIVLRMLARNRSERFGSATSVCRALERFLLPHREAAGREAIARWLESVSGAERARLKRAIAQGRDPKGHFLALAPARRLRHREDREPRARAIPPMRKAWSTDIAGGSSISAAGANELWFDEATAARTADPSGEHAPSFLAPSQRAEDTISESTGAILGLAGEQEAPVKSDRPRFATWSLGLFSIAALAAAAVIALDSGARRRAPAEMPAMGSIEIVSEPPGAHILVDGEPTGMETPAILRDLPRKKELEISVGRQGFTVEKAKLVLTTENTERRIFRLKRAVGIVRFVGFSKNADVYVDDRRVDAAGELELPLGRHTVRVESGPDLILSRTIEVGAEAQEINLPAKKE